MKTWQEIINSAEMLINFLSLSKYFSQAYDGKTDFMIIRDAQIGMKYAAEESDDYTDWETARWSDEVFPKNFDWNDRIVTELNNINYFGIWDKDFSGADKKWENDANCMIKELMQIDIQIMFYCYANDYWPEIWKDIRYVYLHNGFPCGWNGHYPNGKLVVFSNS